MELKHLNQKRVDEIKSHSSYQQVKGQNQIHNNSKARLRQINHRYRRASNRQKERIRL